MKAFAARFGALEANEKYFMMGMERQLVDGHPEILAAGSRAPHAHIQTPILSPNLLSMVCIRMGIVHLITC